MTTKITPMNDLLFKKIFASPGNEDILMGLIKDLLNIPVDSLKILTPYNIESIKHDLELADKNKNSVNKMTFTEADIKVQTSANQIITIEMQRHHMKNFIDRSLYYLAETYASHFIKDGHINYLEGTTVYGLNIIDFNPFKAGVPALYHYGFAGYDGQWDLKNATIDAAVHPMELVYFNLVSKNLESHTNQMYWKQFFKGDDISPQAPAYIQKAKRLTERENLSKEEFDMITSQEKHALDYQAGLDYATEVGVEKGIDIGKAEMLYNAYCYGHSINEIAEFQRMDVDEVKYYIDFAKSMKE